MRKLTKIEKQEYARLHEIILTGRERYLETGGDPQRCPSGRYGDDYLTIEERREALALGSIGKN